MCALLWVTFLKYKHSFNSLCIFYKMQPLIDCTYNPFLYRHALQEASLQAGVCAFECILSSEIITLVFFHLRGKERNHLLCTEFRITDGWEWNITCILLIVESVALQEE